MNNHQKMFHDFFMNMVMPGKEEEAEAVLAAGFKKQDEGAFNAEYFKSVAPKYFELIKPECADQLKKAMAHFSSNL